MSRKLIISIIIVSFSLSLSAQLFDAGDDVTICSGVGAVLGDTTATIPSGWCFKWEPEEGLSNPKDAHPTAKPDKTTTYTVTVITENWQYVSTDQVKVHVGWGGIVFDPPYLFQSGESESQAELTEDDSGGIPKWSIQGDDLDCTIDEVTGLITDGNKFGSITVRAARNQVDNDECYAEADIDINPGVKDVIASDVISPGRVAKNGDTLVLIDDYAARIKAVPNEGGFPSGWPKWYPSINTPVPTTRPPDGTMVHLTDELISFDEEFVLGPSPDNAPSVYIQRLSPVEISLPVGSIVNGVTGAFNKINTKLKKYVKAPVGFNVAVDINNSSISRVAVEKYKDPGWAYKWTYVFAPKLSISGEVCHPAATVNLVWPFTNDTIFSSKACLTAGLSTSFIGGFVFDPSNSKDGYEILDEIKLAAELSIGVIGSVTAGVSGAFNISGEFSITTKPGFIVTADITDGVFDGKLYWQSTFKPLVAAIDFKATSLSDPMKKATLLSMSLPMIPATNSPKLLLGDFGN